MVADMKTYLQPLFDKMFLLPSEWEFSRYTLGDFRKVFEDNLCNCTYTLESTDYGSAAQGA